MSVRRRLWRQQETVRQARQGGREAGESGAHACKAAWPARHAHPPAYQLKPIVCFTMFCSLRRLPAAGGKVGMLG